MLYVLPFDHRGSFQRMLFPDTPAADLSDEQHQKITDYKQVCFDAMKSIGEERGFDDLAVLVDEQYGSDIHAEAQEVGVRNMLTMEKSGQEVFDFQEEDWKGTLERIRPAFAKALIRVTMGKDNTVQNGRLKELNDYCDQQGIKFLIEPLIQPSEGDMDSVDGDKDRFDAEVRPKRFAECVTELHEAGVQPDVWKIEGCDTEEGMKISSDAVENGGKNGVEIVILGRGAGMDRVEHWLKIGAQGKHVSGFAVGRTLFAETISQLHAGELDRDAAVKIIADKYKHCIEVFEGAR